MNKEKNPDEAQLREFNTRIKNYDTLSFLEDQNFLLGILNNMGKRQTDQDVIAKLTGAQLRSLPLRRWTKWIFTMKTRLLIS